MGQLSCKINMDVFEAGKPKVNQAVGFLVVAFLTAGFLTVDFLTLVSILKKTNKILIKFRNIENNGKQNQSNTNRSTAA